MCKQSIEYFDARKTWQKNFRKRKAEQWIEMALNEKNNFLLVGTISTVLVWRETHVPSTFNGIKMIEFLKGGFHIQPRLELGVFKLKINFKCSFFSCEMNSFLLAGETWVPAGVVNGIMNNIFCCCLFTIQISHFFLYSSVNNFVFPSCVVSSFRNQVQKEYQMRHL